MVDLMRTRGDAGPAGVCVAGVIVLAAVLLVAGCIVPGADGGSEVQEVFNQTVSAAGVEALDLQSINGGCEVRSWTEPGISILATKRSLYGSAELDRVSVSVTEGATLMVRTEHPQPPARVSVDYVILVPASVGSVRVEISNGAVLVDGVSAQVSAESSNGAVHVLDAGGDVAVRTSNGAVEVRDVNGTVTARTSNGAITVGNATALGDLETSNGRLEAEVRSTAGDVTLRTSNGNVDLALAPGLNAQVDAETSAGRISLPDGLLQVDEQSVTRLRAQAGAGGDTIMVRTSNGDIRLTVAG